MVGELLCSAAQRGNEVELSHLLEQPGFSVDDKDNSGKTALMSAALWGRERVVTLLLQRGADIHAKDKRGWTALMSAASRYEDTREWRPLHHNSNTDPS